MKILSIDYNIEYESLDIYVSGCKGKNGIHCEGCHNPHSWEFNQGISYLNKLPRIKNYIKGNPTLINNIMIFGGEPLDQDENKLIDFLTYLRQFKRDVWLFTRFNLNEVDNKILTLLDYIKCGEYDKNKIVDDNVQYGIKLATSNQNIYAISKI